MIVERSRVPIFVRLLLFASSVLAGNPCVQKQFGRDRLVCVCNATYCDTVDQVPALGDGQFVQYTSNIAGLRFEQTFGVFEEAPLRYGVHMGVKSSYTFQTIFGFGAAFTDAAGINVNSLSFDTQENLLRSYFSPEGIELNFGRVPIAGSDFSTHTYTYDDVERDTRLEHFNLTSEDFNLKIPLIKRAKVMSKRELHLLAAAWTAPPWMKTNNAYVGPSLLIGEHYEIWANYHIKFLDEYEKEGLTFWSISTGNEPSLPFMPMVPFNSLGWTANSQLEWVREYLGPALRSSRHNKTRIITVDDQRFMLPWWILTMKLDHKAADYIDGVGLHWYFDDMVPIFLLDCTHRMFPDKFILATEACAGFLPQDTEKVILGSWDRGESYMDSIMKDLHHWVVGWVDWNLALNPTGGPNWSKNFVDAAIIVNSDGDEFYKQPTFYALGHFAKFVPEGSVRVAITPSEESGVQSIAFKTPDHTTVIILYNKKSTERPVTITDPNKGHMNLILSKKSFQTLIYKT